MDFEIQYEQYLIDDSNEKNVRYLLPTKTRNGLLEKQHTPIENFEIENEFKEKNLTQSTHLSTNMQTYKNLLRNEPVSTVQLLSHREETLKIIQYQIGILSCEILEDPGTKLNNLLLLLNFMDERKPEIYVTVRKLAATSIMEIFKDLLPVYNIHLFQKGEVKLKKETLILQNQESSILKYYRQYLQKLEMMASIIKKKNYLKCLKKEDVYLGVFAIDCMTKLLIDQPYFNFSSNIANYLVPFLDHKNRRIRDITAKCFIQTFKEDMRGDLSLIIVRRINNYIKKRKMFTHIETLTVLLSLRIQDIKLDKNKEDISNNKKCLMQKQRIPFLSRQDRKRNNKLKQIEKEMFETKAEESRQFKKHIFREIAKLLFSIYFRILKYAPNGYLLLSCLEGLSKFSECIHIDFYQDIVNILKTLLDNNNLSFMERICCINTAFRILPQQSSVLNIDPNGFYKYLYRCLLNINIGNTHFDAGNIVENLSYILINNYRNINQDRLLAFVKRLFTIMLNLQHNSILGILCLLKIIIQNSEVINNLLDTDRVEAGIYFADADYPEYSKARCTSLWELAALLRHYHFYVQNIAKIIVSLNKKRKNDNYLLTNILNSCPKEVYTKYDPSGGIFDPIIIKPKHCVLSIQSCKICINTFNEFRFKVNFEDVFNDGYYDMYSELTQKTIV